MALQLGSVVATLSGGDTWALTPATATSVPNGVRKVISCTDLASGQAAAITLSPGTYVLAGVLAEDGWRTYRSIGVRAGGTDHMLRGDNNYSMTWGQVLEFTVATGGAAQILGESHNSTRTFLPGDVITVTKKAAP